MSRLLRSTGTASSTFGTVDISIHRLAAGAEVQLRGAQNLILVSVRQGQIVLGFGSGEISLEKGDSIFLGVDAECGITTQSGAKLVVVSAPGELVSDVQIDLPKHEPRLVSDSSVLLESVIAFAQQTVRAADGEGSRLGEYYIERLLQEMVQGLLVDTGRVDRMPRRQQDPYRQALSMLALQYADPALTSEDLAESLSLSRRQLEREFSKRGTTIRKELRRLRVERAIAMLRDPGYAMLSVDDIGRHVGFSGASSLARVIREEGRDSPSKLRRIALGHEGGAAGAT